jgi:hypothetical protein
MRGERLTSMRNCGTERFAERVDAFGANEVGPVFELGTEELDVRRQRVGVGVGSEDVGAEERFGVDGRGAARCGAAKVDELGVSLADGARDCCAGVRGARAEHAHADEGMARAGRERAPGKGVSPRLLGTPIGDRPRRPSMPSRARVWPRA